MTPTPAEVLREVEEALKDCADDLEVEVRAQYGVNALQGVHPALEYKYKRDMTPVLAARRALASLRGLVVTEGWATPVSDMGWRWTFQKRTEEEYNWCGNEPPPAVLLTAPEEEARERKYTGPSPCPVCGHDATANTEAAK